MLMRSTSSPIVLDSWINHHHQCYASQESPEAEPQLHRISMNTSNSMDHNSPKLLHHHNNNTTLRSIPKSDYVKDSNVKTLPFSVEKMLSSSGMEEDSKEGDAYYERMIETNPGNSLFLGNYARFLKEVKGELKKAEEYCERAILGNPEDGNFLSLYAQLIWQIHKDHRKANTYFLQAVQSAPHDSYVQASYAKFLWEVEEEEDDEEYDHENPLFPPYLSPHHPTTITAPS